MVDTQVKKEVLVSDVLVDREFPDVLSKELPGVPPERQVEFTIDLVLGASQIPNVSYRLAPPEMQELSSLLQELLGK